MKQVFTPCTGAVMVPRPGCQNSDFLIINIDGADFTSEFIVTGLSLEMAGNYQFLHTVNDFVYFYAFGDRVGTLNVTGVSFIKRCDSTYGGQPKAGSAFLAVYNYYMQNRSSQREKGQALSITITSPDGAQTFFGFLVGMRIEATAAESGPIGYWTMRFDVLPQKTAPTAAPSTGGGFLVGPGAAFPTFNPTELATVFFGDDTNFVE
jgi:hypothetical protein